MLHLCGQVTIHRQEYPRLCHKAQKATQLSVFATALWLTLRSCGITAVPAFSQGYDDSPCDPSHEPFWGSSAVSPILQWWCPCALRGMSRQLPDTSSLNIMMMYRHARGFSKRQKRGRPPGPVKVRDALLVRRVRRTATLYCERAVSVHLSPFGRY